MPAALPIRRILILRTGAMGDILHALPAIAALRAALPSAYIGWAVEPHWAPLLGAPLVDRIHLAPTRAWNRAPLAPSTALDIIRLARELRAERYHLAIDLQGSIRSAVLARISAARLVVGPARPRESAARLLYHRRIQTFTPNVIAQAAEIVSGALAPASNPELGLRLSPMPVTIPCDPLAEAWCDTTLAGLGEHKAFILICPVAGWGAKEWGAENYRQLAESLSHTNRVLINSGLTPDPLTTHVAQATNTMCIPASIAQLVALARRAALVIGGDTGPVHLAAMLGRPTLVLFGPTDPSRNGPAFPQANVTVIRHPTSQTDHRRHPHTESGLARITVEEVAAAAFTLLGHREDAHG